MKKASNENFKEIIKGKKVLVDIWAPWCGPCKRLTPILEELEKETPDVEFYELNADENGDTCAELGIRAIPTVMLYSNGMLVDSFSGALPKDKIAQWLKDN